MSEHGNRKPIPKEKPCKICKVVKPIEEFHKMNSTRMLKSGEESQVRLRHSYCRPCLVQYRKERYAKANYDKKYCKENKQRIDAYQDKYYQKNKESIKIKNREYYHKHSAEMKDRNKEWYENNPGASAAYYQLRKAEKAGILIRPSKCQCCDRSMTRLEAHHEAGYTGDNALKVVYLCKRVHRAIHGNSEKSEEYKKLVRKLYIEQYGEIDDDRDS